MFFSRVLQLYGLPAFANRLNISLRCLHSSERSHYDIIIAGGGMVGTTLACKLGKSKKLCGQTILLLEGSPHQDFKLSQKFSNRVSALNPSTQQLLSSIGAWNHVVEMRCKPVKKMQIWDAISDAMITFNKHEMVEDIAYIVENDVLLESINKELKKLNNVSVKYSAKIKSYSLPNESILSTESNGLAQLELEDGSVFTCSLLVGADGANSQVRKAMGTQYLSWNYHQMGIVATLKLPEPAENVVAWQRFLPTGPIALLPLDDNFYSLVWTTTTEHAKELSKLSDECFVDAVNNALWKQYPKQVVVESASKVLNSVLETLSLPSNAVRQLQPSIASVEAGSRAAFPLGFGHSVRYVSQNVVLVGDAAHRVHPLAGQGVNLGFGDVQCLCEVLEETISDGNRVGSLLHLLKYETLRQCYNVPTMAAIDGLQKLYGTTLTPVVMLRTLGLQIVHSLSPVKKAIMNHAS